MSEKIKELIREDQQASVPQTTEKAKAKKPAKLMAQKEGEAHLADLEYSKAFINSYGFIHLGADLMAKFGAKKGEKTAITIEVKDGVLMIRKA